MLSKYRGLSSKYIQVNEQKRLVITGSNVDVESSARGFLLKGAQLAEELRRCSGAVFEIDENKRVVLRVHGVRLALTCWEELFIAHEVFHRKIYNIALKRPFHVMDIGMNTGTSALFFASMAGCERISGYELFRPTLHRALENIALNPTLGGKIKAYPYGLGAVDEKLVLDYFPEFKGSVGRHGLPEYSRPKVTPLTLQRENVEIRSVVPVLERLLADAASGDFICKIDCEGAEYEIVSCLADADLLRRVSVFLIEWHLHGAHPIKKLLIDAGFDCLSLDEDSENHGMLYAFKSST
jgi:FkbM family methyltransferase